jgi:hypothetical protein
MRGACSVRPQLTEHPGGQVSPTVERTPPVSALRIDLGEQFISKKFVLHLDLPLTCPDRRGARVYYSSFLPTFLKPLARR